MADDQAQPRAVTRTEVSQQLGISEQLAEVLAVSADNRLVVTEKIVNQAMARREALPVIPALPGEELAISRDYLQQHQEKSLTRALDRAKLAMTAASPLPSDFAFAAARIPGDPPFVDRAGGEFGVLIDYYAGVIEHICKKIHLPTHGGVSCGIVWDSSMGPSQKAVMTTSTSIVVIPVATMMFCHFLAKLLANSFVVRNAGPKVAVDHDAKAVLARIRRDRHLRAYAAMIFGYLTTSDRRTLGALKNARGLRRPVWFSLLYSLELFVMAHEFGHHIAVHGAGDFSLGVDGPEQVRILAQELEADHLAALIMAHAGVEFKYPFAQSGAAGVVMLTALDMMRRARDVLESGAEQPFRSHTHPPLRERLLMMETLRYDPREAEAMKTLRAHLHEMMEGIWEIIRPRLVVWHKQGLRPAPIEQTREQWLRLFR